MISTNYTTRRHPSTSKRAMTALSLAAALVSSVLVSFAQDLEFMRALENTQKQRPATLTSTARIAPESEPGTPLVIRGRVFAEDGRTPVPDVTVFAYHTDRTGLYNRVGSPPHSWRLRGWALTTADGAFEFRTIRPGSYPGTTNPQHVHFTVFTDKARYHAGELQFDDDKLVTADQRASSKREGQFGSVRPVRHEGGVDQVELALRLMPRDRF
jgi:protocatechuate 3,4-dioxygenase, beta subunit